MADEKVYVDEADGVKRVMNNLKLYMKLLAKFRNENNLDELNTLLKAGDLEKAQGAAHTIKGLAGNLSLVELQAAREMITRRSSDHAATFRCYADLCRVAMSRNVL
jgi:HPt (histidine-containing phosphotransfer) domain-containing protein